MYGKFLILFIILSGYAFAQRAGADIKIGRSFLLPSQILAEERPVDLYLPPRYNFTSEKYPVIILLDGEQHFLHTVGSAGFLAGTGKIPQMIIAGIPNTNRNRDFTPVQSSLQPESGGAERFIGFLRLELLPYLDRNFRTAPFRILIGHSLCGMFTLYQLLKHGDLFQGYIAASPYLMYNDLYLIKMIERKEHIPYYPGNRFLYLTTGNEPEYLQALMRLEQQLPSPSSGRLAWRSVRYPEEDHNSSLLRAIPDGLTYLFNDWSIPDSVADGGLDSVIAYYERFSNRYGYDQPVPETQLNTIAYQTITDGPIAEALRMFRYNAALYPESPNVYDSLGEGLEAAGLLAEAAEQYRTAIEKGRKQADGNLPAYEEHLRRVLEKIGR